MKPKHVLVALARHAMANSERVLTTMDVVGDSEFVTIHGHEVFGLVNITIPQSIERMMKNMPETMPPGRISLDELRLTAARDALQGLLLDKHAGVGPWRHIATAKVDQIDAQLKELRDKRTIIG